MVVSLSFLKFTQVVTSVIIALIQQLYYATALIHELIPLVHNAPTPVMTNVFAPVLQKEI